MDIEALRNSIQSFCSQVNANKWTKFVEEYAKIGDSEIYGGKHGGSDAEHEGAEYIAARLEEIGVPEIEIIETPTSRYQFNDGSITVVADAEAEETRIIKPMGYRSPGTAPQGITAKLVDVGTATRDEYSELAQKGVDIKNTVVMFEGMGALEAFNLSAQIDESVKNGAAAVIIYMTEDILNDDTIRVQTPLNILDIPVVGISSADAKYLKQQLADGPLSINIKIDAEYTPDEGYTKNVVGIIPGSESEEIIFFTAHLDHFFRCIQDNMASCATLLGIADAIIKSGYKPKRSIAFAFHGSHECGIIDSKYPYITGSYLMVQSKLGEWKNKAIAEINIEYAALPLKQLRAASSLSADGNLANYYQYSPELTGGFEEKTEEPLSIDNYAVLTWVDCIAYSGEGIPAYTNDVLTEQLEGTSPYIGRDHSNHDNMDSYSIDALRDSIRYYGGFGIYLDQLPYVRLDFSRQADRLYAESEFDELDKEGLRTKAYRRKLDKLSEAGKKLTALIDELNENNADHAKARQLNKEVLKLNDWFQKKLDMIAPSDFLITASGHSLYNISNLSEAAELLAKGDSISFKAAKTKLFEVDLASTSYYFSESIVNRMRDQVFESAFAERRTWARGRELPCETLYKLMSSLKHKEDAGIMDFKNEIKLINKEVNRELRRFLKELKSEMKIIVEGTERIEKLCQKQWQ